MASVACQGLLSSWQVDVPIVALPPVDESTETSATSSYTAGIARLLAYDACTTGLRTSHPSSASPTRRLSVSLRCCERMQFWVGVRCAGLAPADIICNMRSRTRAHTHNLLFRTVRRYERWPPSSPECGDCHGVRPCTFPQLPLGFGFVAIEGHTRR